LINLADIVVGLAWGDEAKGKITAQLASTRSASGGMFYDCVARWAGGNNAGHTVWVDGEKFKTHLVPSGVFYGVKSVVGPGCVLHPESFMSELSYLESNGFDTSLVKVSPKCHIVKQSHIDFDRQKLAGKLGTTGRGIAPAYADKAARTGLLAKDVLDKSLIWDENLEGNLLCEGAQGIWLDIDHGLYPYVTSSTTLPYGACSIGFPPQVIRRVWGAAKIYDTRSGEDPRFPSSLLDDEDLLSLANLGAEYGVTTGRRRKVNWLDLDMLILAVKMSGVTNLVVSKCDVISRLGIYRLRYNNELASFSNINDMCHFISEKLTSESNLIKDIRYSSSPMEI
jgi:adenylosuccinate synthase